MFNLYWWLINVNEESCISSCILPLQYDYLLYISKIICYVFIFNYIKSFIQLLNHLDVWLLYHVHLKCIKNVIVAIMDLNRSNYKPHTNLKNVVINHPKYHLLELHFIIYFDKKYDSQESYFTSSKNMTPKSRIPHHSKIWLPKVIFHIIQKYDSRKSYFTSSKIMTYESHIPLHPKIWLTRVVFHMHHPKIWLIRVIFHINKNMTHESHFPH